MDLFSIARAIWRHRLATVPVLLLTALGAGYVLLVKPPVYEATASYVLINPPAPPTAEEIERDPALGRIRTDNPYTRFGDQSVVVDVLSRTVGADGSREELVRAGADGRFTVVPSTEFGFSSPIVQITGVGSSADSAIRTAQLVGDAVTRELTRMQAAQGVDRRYMITPLRVDVPDKAQLRVSGRLRLLIGVLGMGVILLFVVVSVADALARRHDPGPEPESEQTVVLRRVGGHR